MDKYLIKSVGTLRGQGSRWLTIAELVDGISDFLDHATFRENGVNTGGFLSFSLCN